MKEYPNCHDMEGNTRNYNRFILSTNNMDPLNIAETERRFFAVRASGMYCNNLEYFGKLLESMRDVNVQGAFYKYLKERDISGRNWMRVPVTEYLNNAKLSNISNIYHFLYAYIDSNEGDKIDDTARQIYMDYMMWCRDMRQRSVIEREFGIKLKDIDGIEKYVTKTGKKWVINKENTCKILRKKGFDCCCHTCEE